jgi:tetratricopeptide (TPR) repeat protein
MSAVVYSGDEAGPKQATGDFPAAHGVPQADGIREQLARIITSREFRSSLRLTSFLTFVVETALAGDSKRIKSYTIAVEALGRDSNFDPQNDPIVRVQAGRLRRALAHYYSVGGRDDPVVIDMPSGSYAPAFRRRNPPIGLRKHPLAVRRVLYRFARRRLRLIAFVAVVALCVSLVPNLAILAWQRLNDNATSIASSRSGNSDPLANSLLPQLYVEPISVSGTPLSNSISSSMLYRRLIDTIARFDDLTVVAERPQSEPGPARRDYSLASSLQYYADGTASVVISAGETFDGAIIWSKTFEGREHTPDPEKKGRMVYEMAMTLLQPFGVIASREAAKRAAGDSMTDPYRCVLDSHDYLRSYDLNRAGPIRACLEAATAKSASWVSPYVQLARVDMRDYQFGLATGPPETPELDRAFAAANQAIAIRPTSAAAFNVLQDVLLARGDLLGARKAGEVALQLNPYDRFAAVDHALLLVLLGETENGLALMHQITPDNPAMPSRFRFTLALAAYLQGDLPAALAQTGEITNPLFPPTLMLRALVAAKLGDRVSARQTLDHLYASYPAWRSNLRASIRRFLPDAGMVDRIASDFTAATAELTQ